MRRKLFGLTLLGLLLLVQVTAQEKEEENADQPAREEVKKRGLDPQRLFFGGNFGVTFGDFTFVNVSPQVGYRINPVFSAGAGVNFIYQSDKYYSGSREVKNTLGYAGLNVFGRVNPFKFILLNAQPEVNYVWGTTRVEGLADSKIDPTFVPSLLMGAGIALPMGGRGSMIAMLQYDVIQDSRSPYGRNAFLTFGVNF
jgi:hypothetical protein